VKPESRRSVISLLAATQVLAWSFNYIAGKIALEHLLPLTLVSFRIVLAGAIYLVIFLVAPRPARIRWRDLPMLALLGFCGVAINQAGFTLSLNYTSIGHVALIVSVGPILVLLLAWLSGQETMTPAKALGMSLSFGGVALLTIQQGFELHSGGMMGDLIALGAVTGFAFFVVLSKRAAGRYDIVAFTSLIHMTGAILYFPLALRQAVRIDWGQVAWQGWAGLLYMSIFGSIVGYLAFYKLLAHLSASQIASLNYLLPIVATTLGVLLLHETITRGFLLAAAFVLSGVWLAQSSRWRTLPAD
jgi:drug/metabolite transporter (DMT)-like permease